MLFQFAVARFADNSVSLFDGDKVVRTFHTIHRPTGIIHLGASHPNLMAIAEWAQISIWDDRVSEKSGYTLRVTPGTEPIFALCAGNPGNPGQKHLFAYGGAARTVTIFDIEKMSNIGHWTGSLKYDILYLNFAAKHSNHVFATGFDSEVRTRETPPPNLLRAFFLRFLTCLTGCLWRLGDVGCG